MRTNLRRARRHRHRGRAGIGREHALEFARQGARVVVNDLGAEPDGAGRPARPPRWSTRIRPLGGEAVANGDDVADFEAAASASSRPRSTRSAGSTAGQQRGDPAGPDVRQHEPRRSGTTSIRVHLRGHFCSAVTRPLLAGPVQGGRRRSTPGSSTPARAPASWAASARPNYARGQGGDRGASPSSRRPSSAATA